MRSRLKVSPNKSIKVTNGLPLCIAGAVSFFANNHIGSIVLPLYVYSLNGSALEVGLMASVMGLVSTISRPYIGNVLDIYGRRGPMLLASFLLAIIAPMYMLSTMISSLLVLRVLQGICFAVVTSGYLSLIGDFSSSASANKVFGYAGLAMPTSLFISPVVVEYLLGKSSGFSHSFIAASLAASVSFIVFHLVTKDYKERDKGKQTKEERAKVRFSLYWGEGKKCAWIGALYLGTVDIVVLSFIPLLADLYSIPYSLFFSTFALGMIFFQFRVGNVIERFGMQNLNLLGYVALGMSMLLIVWSPNAPGLVIAALFFAIGFGSVETSLNMSAIAMHPLAHRGKAIGTLQFFVNAGRTISSLLFGWFGGYFGFSLMFSVIGIMAALPIILKWDHLRKQ